MADRRLTAPGDRRPRWRFPAVAAVRSGPAEPPRGRWTIGWCEVAIVGIASTIAPVSAVSAQAQEGFDPFVGTPMPLVKDTEIRAKAGGAPDLTAPSGLLVAANHILVLDPAVTGIHRFDRQGRWLNTIGSEGDGPGEFRRPTVMGWRTDTLWVADRRLARLTLLDGEGTFLRSVQFRSVEGDAALLPSRMMVTGQVVALPYLSGAAVSRVDSIPLLVLDDDGGTRDTLAWRALGQAVVSVAVDGGQGRPRGATAVVRHPFDHRGMLAYDPFGEWVYVATWRTRPDTEAYLELLQITARGDTSERASLPFGRAPVPARDIESHARGAQGRLPESVRSKVSARELARAFLQQIARPSVAIVDAMLADEDGTVWFRRTSRTRDAELQRWIAWRPGEGFGGYVEFPADHYLLAATGGLLWTVTRNEFDLPTVTGWSVAQPGS